MQMHGCMDSSKQEKNLNFREIQTGEHYISLAELKQNGDTVKKTITKDAFIDSLHQYRLPLRDLRMLVRSSDGARTKFPSLLPRPQSKCFIFEIEQIRLLCFRNVSIFCRPDVVITSIFVCKQNLSQFKNC